MWLLSSNIDSRPVFLTIHIEVLIIPRLLFYINNKTLNILVFTSCHYLRLIFCFCLWFGKFSLIFLQNLLETLKLISPSVGKLTRYLPSFFQELFQCHIHPKQNIFHLYQFIFQKHLQFLHIQTGHSLIFF